jgi:hypothetical protein
MPSTTTIVVIASWNLPLGIGFGCASCIARLSPWSRGQNGSSALAIRGHYALSSASGRWPIAWHCRKALVSMTSSTSAC